jgi:hypothetical protein
MRGGGYFHVSVVDLEIVKRFEPVDHLGALDNLRIVTWMKMFQISSSLKSLPLF